MSVTCNPLYVNEPGDKNKSKANNLDIWLVALQVRVDNLEAANILKDERIKKLETEIISLKTNAQTTVANNNTSTGNLGWSNLFRNTTSTNESVAVLCAKIANENKDKERLEKFVIISGVEESTSENEAEKKQHDEEKIEEILTTLNLNRTEMKQFNRIKTNPNRSANTRDSALIRLEFMTKESQNKAIKESKNLKDNVSTKKIYINPDKTALERLTEKKLREERNKRNADLENEDEEEVEGRGRQRFGIDTNGKKFYWGIRWGILKRVHIDA